MTPGEHSQQSRNVCLLVSYLNLANSIRQERVRTVEGREGEGTVNGKLKTVVVVKVRPRLVST